MSVQAIRVHPDPILYRPCRAADADDFEGGWVKQVVADLHETMQALEERTGLRASGLAAPQIGYDLRVFVLAQWPHAFVNPEIEYVTVKGQARRPNIEREGCFSLPDVWLDVQRASKIRLRYLMPSGDERAAKMRDRDARAAQHELDHLDGITIVQRAQNGSEALVVAS